MATVIRPELSKKNKYYVEKNRYYELKYFCLQYHIWKHEYLNLDGYSGYVIDPISTSRPNEVSDPTSRIADERILYFNKMKLIEQAALEADGELADYILKAVTEGLTYTTLKSKLNIPCSRDTYYNRYRRFFWILDKTRN